MTKPLSIIYQCSNTSRSGRTLLLAGMLGISFMSPAKSVPPTGPSAAENIVGTVFTPDGKPAAGVTVYPVRWWFERDIVGSALTDSAGRFHLAQWPGGRITVIAAAPDGSLTFATTSGKKPVEIHLVPSTEVHIPFVDENGKPLVNREVAVFPATDKSTLRGTVVDRAFPNLPPALKVKMMGRTDAQGILALPGLPQNTPISVTMNVNDRYEPVVFAGSLRLGPGAMDRVGPIRVALNGSISGRVTVRLTGKPVPNAGVSLGGPGYHNWLGTARTDSTGRYRFTGLFPAAYFIMMQDSNVLQSDPKTGEKSFLPLSRTKKGGWLQPFSYADTPVAAGEKVAGIDFALIKSAGVTAKVVDKEGRPVFGASVSVTMADTSGEGRSTGLDGTCHFQIAPGKIGVRCNTSGPQGRVQQLTLGEGDNKTVLFSTRADQAANASGAKRALAPNFTVQDRKGKPVQLADFRGRVIVLDFWFPTERENEDNDMQFLALRHTAAVVKKMASPDVVALAVDTQDQQEPFIQWIDRHPELNIIHFGQDRSDWHKTGEGIVTTLYRVYGWPVRFIIGRDGTLLKREEGDAINDEADLVRVVTEALREGSP